MESSTYLHPHHAHFSIPPNVRPLPMPPLTPHPSQHLCYILCCSLSISCAVSLCASSKQEIEAEVRHMERVRGNVHVVAMVDAWQEDDIYYLQMELCGETLERFMRREHRLPEPAAIALFTDILEVALPCYALLCSALPCSVLLCYAMLVLAQVYPSSNAALIVASIELLALDPHTY